MRGCINCYGEINTFVTCVLGWFTTEQVKKKHSQIRWQVYSSYVIKKITPGLAVDLISAVEGTQTSRMGNHSIFWTLITNVSGFSGSFTAESGFLSWETTIAETNWSWTINTLIFSFPFKVHYDNQMTTLPHRRVLSANYITITSRGIYLIWYRRVREVF